MIIPIKKIILEMSTALKRRQNFKQAGIIPTKYDPNNTFPQKFIHRNIVDNKGNLLPKKELNDILQNLGKVPNNAYQGAKIANKNYGNSKEILRSFDHSGDSGWIGGEKDRAYFPDGSVGRSYTVHTHPERSISNNIKNLYTDYSSTHMPSGYADKPAEKKTDLDTFVKGWSNKGNSIHYVLVPTEDTSSAMFVNNETKKLRIVPFNMSRNRNNFDLDGNLIRK